MEKEISLPINYTSNIIIQHDTIIDGLIAPLAVADPGIGTFFYIVDQIGLIYLYDWTARSPGIRHAKDLPIFLDLRKTVTIVEPRRDERGLLNMIFNSLNPHIFYIYYTTSPTDQEYP